MGNLKKLAQNARNSVGMGHLGRVAVLRDYMRYVTREQFIIDLADIDDLELLKTLQEAGVRKDLYNAYVERLKQVA